MAALNISPCIDSVFFRFLVLWDCKVQQYYLESCAKPGARRHEGCRIRHYLSWTDSIKKSLLSFFKLWMLYFQRSLSRSDYLEVTTAVVVSCGGRKISPRTSIRCYFYIFWWVKVILEQLRSTRASRRGGCRIRPMISHEQTQSNRVCCFQTWMLYFQRISFEDYLENTAVVVPCGGPKKSPLTSI